MSATDEGPQPVRVNVRSDCICRNHGQPIGNLVFIDPCCRVHYAELEISAIIAIPKTEVTEAELEEWRSRREPAKKRVSYPKMMVAKK
jgi:hypothetical protein